MVYSEINEIEKKRKTQELVLWEDKQDWQTPDTTNQKKQRDDQTNRIRNDSGNILTDTKH